MGRATVSYLLASAVGTSLLYTVFLTRLLVEDNTLFVSLEQGGSFGGVIDDVKERVL